MTRNRSFTYLICIAAFLLGGFLPASAFAHAGLQSIEPKDAATLETAPTQIVLTFSSPVKGVNDSVQVVDGKGDRVDSGTLQVAKSVVTRPVKLDDDGTYFVAWRLVSEDGHTITGSSKFNVGSASSSSEKQQAAVEGIATIDRSLTIPFTLARFAQILGLFIVVGGIWFACVIAPQTRPRLLLVGWFAACIASVCAFILDAAIVSGASLSTVFSQTSLDFASRTPFGSATLVTLLALFACLPFVLLVRARQSHLGRIPAIIAVFIALITVMTLSLTGHAVASTWMEIRVSLDMLHVVAAAIWIGGLLQLAPVVRPAESTLRTLHRFARTAQVCVGLLVASGIATVGIAYGSDVMQALDERWGRLIIAKVVVLAALLPLAWNNGSFFIKRLDEAQLESSTLLKQYIRRETLFLMTILAITVWLIGTPPPGK